MKHTIICYWCNYVITSSRLFYNFFITGYDSGYDSGKSDGISNEKINIAKNLLSMNMTLEDISKATGLTIDEIKKIR